MSTLWIVNPYIGMDEVIEFQRKVIDLAYAIRDNNSDIKSEQFDEFNNIANTLEEIARNDPIKLPKKNRFSPNGF